MTPYEYHVTGRNPFYLIATLITVTLVAGAVVMGAPWWVLVLWGLCAALLVWRVVVNPRAGMSLDKAGLRIYGEGRSHIIALQDIVEVWITYESDGPDGVRVHLKDGTSIKLPAESYPSSRKLRAQLARFGIAHNAA